MERITDDVLARTLIDASPDGLLLVGPDGHIRLANNQAAALFGQAADELVGTSVDQLVPDPQRRSHAVLRQRYADDSARRPMGTDLQLRAVRADGSQFPTEISLSPVTIDGELCTIATVRDVSDRQESQAKVALLKDRERIARDIHDMVIQRLFAAGMSLQGITALIDSSVVRDRISTVTDDLDDTIRQLRHSIFQLGQTDDVQTLSSHVSMVAEERSRHLGFSPHLKINGRLDEIPEFIGDQLVATLTEALSNVARHAEATDAWIEITRADNSVSLMVSDDGIGLDDAPKPHGGLSNMMWRAAELGGSCSIAPSDPVGTKLVWYVPIDASTQ